MRARKSLAEQYLAAHVAPTTPPECARVRRTLRQQVGDEDLAARSQRHGDSEHEENESGLILRDRQGNLAL